MGKRKRNENFEEVNLLNTYKLMLVGPICKRLESGEIELLELSSREIRDFVIREWEALKNRLKKKQDKIKLSEEQEKKVINWFVRELKKLKKKKKKNKKS